MNHFNLENVKYECRSDPDGKKRFVKGIIPYNSRSVTMFDKERNKNFIEVIADTAFNKTLTDRATVVAFKNHNPDELLGSTLSGTLRLNNTPSGLEAEVELADQSYSNDLWISISRGDVRTMSFGFYPVKYDDVGNVRTLREVKLEEISFGVPFAAYPETESIAYVRSLFKTRKMELDSITNALNKEKSDLSDDDKSALKNLISKLNELVEEAVEEKPVEEATSIEPDTSKEALQLEIEIELNN